MSDFSHMKAGSIELMSLDDESLGLVKQLPVLAHEKNPASFSFAFSAASLAAPFNTSPILK